MSLISRLRRRPREPSMTLVEHLEELRRRLFICLGSIGVGAIVGWFLFGPTMSLLRRPFCRYIRSLPRSGQPPTGCRFVFQGVLEAFVLKLQVVVFIGLGVALPVVLYQLWMFIVPALTRRERRMAVPFVFSSMVLFALGALFAFLTLPKGLGFLLGFAGNGLVPLLSANRFITFVMLLTLAFGLSFEFPLVLIFLAGVGVVSSRKLRSWRRPAILLIAIFSAVITPSSDPYTMTAMMVPMILFYELAIIVARLMKK